MRSTQCPSGYSTECSYVFVQCPCMRFFCETVTMIGAALLAYIFFECVCCAVNYGPCLRGVTMPPPPRRGH